MAFTGMDIPAVRQLATQMDAASSEIEQLINRLTSALAGTEWVGNDASAFRDEWQSSHTTNLRQVSERLKTVAEQARKNASEQEAASNA